MVIFLTISLLNNSEKSHDERKLYKGQLLIAKNANINDIMICIFNFQPTLERNIKIKKQDLIKRAPWSWPFLEYFNRF